MSIKQVRVFRSRDEVDTQPIELPDGIFSVDLRVVTPGVSIRSHIRISSFPIFERILQASFQGSARKFDDGRIVDCGVDGAYTFLHQLRGVSVKILSM